MKLPPLQFSAMLRAAREHFARGDFGKAAPVLKALIEQQPGNMEILYDFARCSIHIGKYAEARKALEKCAQALPAEPAIRNQLARVLMLENRFDEAQQAVDHALRLAPGNSEYLARKADIFFTKGDYASAYAVLQPLIESGEPSDDIVFAFARIAPRVNQHRQAADAIEKLLEKGTLSEFLKSQILFRFGALLDGLKEYDRAFAAYAEGNRLRAHFYDPARHSRMIDDMIAAWTPQALERLPRNPVRNELHVFIVGMPRSGTTLVEQILASHPMVFGAGEPNYLDQVANRIQPPAPGEAPHISDLSRLTPKCIQTAALEYTRSVAADAGKVTRITDKMPPNFMHLGLISLLYPKARIIHTTRNPLDTCLSCHFQSWTSVFPWVNDLSHIGAYYNDYVRMMKHWKQVCPLPILDVSYEDLTADQESWSRRMVDFLGLPWDDACLRFYQTERRVRNMNQDLVRQPVYRSSVERWRHYDKHLAPLKSALASSGGATA